MIWGVNAHFAKIAGYFGIQQVDKMNHNLWASAPEGQQNEPVPNKPLRQQN